MSSTFADFNLPSEIVRTLEALGITEPTPIQAVVLPDALAGRDILGKAPTGSGKTLAFGLPLLQLVGKAESKRPRGLVLAPTRELAEQIRRDLQPLANAVGRQLVTIYGGVAIAPQVKALRAGADIAIATPGRLMDLIEQGEVALDRVDRVVIDEADRMADMGFLPDVRSILDLTSPKRQTVLFSATLDKAVAVLTTDYQQDPMTHSVGEADPDLTLVDHRFLRVRQEDKTPVAAETVKRYGSTMIFCRTRVGVDRVTRRLKDLGVRAAWIHGGRTQPQRDAALMAFTDGRAEALVATDVAARGIHVDEVACVLHYDPPADQKDYVHRSGRTARAGERGTVVCLVTKDHYKRMVKMADALDLDSVFEQFTPTAEVKSLAADKPTKAKSAKGKPKPTKGKAARGKAGKGKEGAGTSKRSGKPRPKNKKRSVPKRGSGSKRAPAPGPAN